MESAAHNYLSLFDRSIEIGIVISLPIFLISNDFEEEIGEAFCSNVSKFI